MKKSIALLLACVLVTALMLSGCGGSGGAKVSSMQIDSVADNTLAVSAENAKTDQLCTAMLTIGEGEDLVVDADFADQGELRVRWAVGEYDQESFPMETSEMSIVGGDAAAVGSIEPGLYTVAVQAGRDGLTGTAKIFTRPASGAKTADYSAVTALDADIVEDFASRSKDAYLAADWAALADLIAYPITVAGTELGDAEAFLSFMADKTVAEVDRQEMEAETCENLFVNGQGICLGAGEIWISDANYLTDAEPLLQIIALNGIE